MFYHEKVIPNRNLVMKLKSHIVFDVSITRVFRRVYSPHGRYPISILPTQGDAFKAMDLPCQL